MFKKKSPFSPEAIALQDELNLYIRQRVYLMDFENRQIMEDAKRALVEEITELRPNIQAIVKARLDSSDRNHESAKLKLKTKVSDSFLSIKETLFRERTLGNLSGKSEDKKLLKQARFMQLKKAIKR